MWEKPSLNPRQRGVGIVLICELSVIAAVISFYFEYGGLSGMFIFATLFTQFISFMISVGIISLAFEFLFNKRVSFKSVPPARLIGTFLKQQREAKQEKEAIQSGGDGHQEGHRQQLEEEIDSIRSELAHVNTLINEDNLGDARKRLVDLSNQCQSLYETAEERLHGNTVTEEYEEQVGRLRILWSECSIKTSVMEDIGTLQSELIDIDTPNSERELKNAKRRLENIETRTDNLSYLEDPSTLSNAPEERAAIERGDFDALYQRLSALEQRRQDRLKDITERLETKTRPAPETIPRAPNIAVEYDALTEQELIGEGGNAVVTKAAVPTADGVVTLAIKKPRLTGGKTFQDHDRVMKEAETWDKLDDHDHIVGVVDYGSKPLPWIAMEYMDAGHLGKRSGTMEFPQTLWTALAVTKGVRHAHQKGVAHLDLKPENILFRSIEDAWDVPKVADWGLSKQLLDHSNSVEGLTPHYAAPEQFSEEHDSTDNITDIYQLGAVFYELFTGRRPFEGKPFQVIDKVKDEDPTPPSDLADVPEEVDRILLRALAKKKDDRYDDIVYLRDNLQELFDNW